MQHIFTPEKKYAGFSTGFLTSPGSKFVEDEVANDWDNTELLYEVVNESMQTEELKKIE